MKVSQFNRAKEIIASLEDLEKMKKNLSNEVANHFTRLEKDNDVYSYDKKVKETPVYPKVNEFALVLQSELVDVIESRIEAQKKALNEELDTL